MFLTQKTKKWFSPGPIDAALDAINFDAVTPLSDILSIINMINSLENKLKVIHYKLNLF